MGPRLADVLHDPSMKPPSGDGGNWHARAPRRAARIVPPSMKPPSGDGGNCGSFSVAAAPDSPQ